MLLLLLLLSRPVGAERSVVGTCSGSSGRLQYYTNSRTKGQGPGNEPVVRDWHETFMGNTRSLVYALDCAPSDMLPLVPCIRARYLEAQWRVAAISTRSCPLSSLLPVYICLRRRLWRPSSSTRNWPRPCSFFSLRNSGESVA
jgi:hypothetical protein